MVSKMKKHFLFLFTILLVAAISAEAQEELSSYVTEINDQVWKPFKQSYESRDAKVFNSLHTDDALRITEGGITPGPEYKARIIEGFGRPYNGSISIDFAHEHRLYYGDLAYEVGYYRITYNRPGQDVAHSYGRFHVMLRKIDGRWKIAQDWDTEMIGTRKISEEDFESATPLMLK
jgi:ketosteroid isomerase-like protein